MSIIWILIIIIGICGLSFEIAESRLSDKIKKLLFLDKYYSIINILSKLEFYKKLLPMWTWLTLIVPIIVLISLVIFNSWKLMQELVNCPFCVTAQLSFWLFLMYFNYSLVYSLVFAGIATIITRLLAKVI